MLIVTFKSLSANCETRSTIVKLGVQAAPTSFGSKPAFTSLFRIKGGRVKEREETARWETQNLGANNDITYKTIYKIVMVLYTTFLHPMRGSDDFRSKTVSCQR